MEMDSTNNNLRRQTNWYVITGGPGSGKTTTVNLLKARGYKTTIEHARHYIDTPCVTGKTVEEVIKNQKEFQSGVLDIGWLIGACIAGHLQCNFKIKIKWF